VRVKSHSACGNSTLCVEINFVRVEITRACRFVSDSHAYVSKLLSCEWKPACKTTLFGWKLHFACGNHSYAC
jgi:hypothetical protein